MDNRGRLRNNRSQGKRRNNHSRGKRQNNHSRDSFASGLPSPEKNIQEKSTQEPNTQEPNTQGSSAMAPMSSRDNPVPKLAAQAFRCTRQPWQERLQQQQLAGTSSACHKWT